MTAPNAGTWESPARGKREAYQRLLSQLESERSSFLPHWRELNDYVRPRRGRFFLQDRNRGDRRNNKIIDSTATMAARTLSSGMMSGVTSPARPWFRLTTSEPDMADNWEVKAWLHDVTQRMSTVFLRSNLYNVLPILYSDLGVFGTGAIMEEEDDDTVVRFTSFPIGSYMLSCNANGQVRTFARSFEMTTRQAVDKFVRGGDGEMNWEVASDKLKADWDNGRREAWHEVAHVICRNEEYDEGHVDSKYKLYSDCYYESAVREGRDQEKFLREKGFDEFPIFAPRWETTGEDVYATSCPGMEALGDIKQLQHGEKKGLIAIDKMIDPPMVAPPGMRSSKLTVLPGHVSYVAENQNQSFRPAHEVNFRIDLLEGKQEQVRSRINRCFYADLFQSLLMSDRRQMTAREVDERHEEKLLALGPVLERLNGDVFDPLIDRTFNIMLRRNQLPLPPEILQGAPLRIEYISIMAQAQKMVGLAGLERFATDVSLIAEVNPEALDKIDSDEMIEAFGDMTGVPPKLIVPADKVAEIRGARAKRQQVAAQAENLKNLGAGAKDLAAAPTEGKNALTDLLSAQRDGAPQQNMT